MHRLWTCEGLTKLECDGIQQTMVQQFGSDKSANGVNRVLRLPGFFHMKGDPHLVRLVGGFNDKIGMHYPYTKGRLLEASPPRPKQTERREREPNWEGDKKKHDMSMMRTQIAPAPRFPIAVFGPLKQWVEQQAEAKGASPDYVAAGLSYPPLPYLLA